MINTGLLLRRPYESEYSAFRRFLVANRFTGTKDLKAEFDQVGILSQAAARRRGPTPFPLMAEAARLWEEQFCLANGLSETPGQTMQHMNHREPLHNCPVCAAQCYHSSFYQIDWVTTCPLHHRPLSTLCPTCKLPWPKPSELLNRRCAQCSARLTPTDLVKSGAFAQAVDTRFFDQVFAAIKTHDQSHELNFSCGHVGDHHFSEHHSVSVHNHAWPSLVAYGDPSLIAAFHAFGANLTPACDLVFQIKARRTEDLSSSSHAYWQELVLRQFHKDLLSQLNRRFHNANIGESVFPSFNSLYSPALIPNLCRAVWRIILAENASARPTRSQGEDQRIQQITGEPLAPCVMTHVIESAPPGSNIDDRAQYRLPRALQVWLFRCDIWWSFGTLLQSIDEVAARLENGDFRYVTGHVFEGRRWTEPRYLISRHGDQKNRIKVTIPAWVSRFSLNGLNLKIESQAESTQ